MNCPPGPLSPSLPPIRGGCILLPQYHSESRPVGWGPCWSWLQQGSRLPEGGTVCPYLAAVLSSRGLWSSAREQAAAGPASTAGAHGGVLGTGARVGPLREGLHCGVSPPSGLGAQWGMGSGCSLAGSGGQWVQADRECPREVPPAEETE